MITRLKDIASLSELEKENKAIKQRIIGEEILLSIKENNLIYYQPARQVIFGVIIMLNIKVTVIETKHYQLKNISIKVDHI